MSVGNTIYENFDFFTYNKINFIVLLVMFYC